MSASLHQDFSNPPVRHVLIIGGTKGLGRTLTKMLATREQCLISAISRNPPTDPVKNVSYFIANIQERPARESALSASVAKNGPIHSIIFCQRYRGNGDAWAGEIDVTLTATMEVLEWASRHFCDKSSCSAVLVGSVASQAIVCDQPAGYHVVKAGIESLARYYAVKWGPAGIRVNVVAPSAFIKEESQKYYDTHPEAAARWAKLSPLQRMGTTEEVAEAVLFLASNRANFITGQTLVVDGGMGLRIPTPQT